MPDITLSLDDWNLILSALDSHRYWQLSQDHYRRDGFVIEPGSDDADDAEEIAEVDDLEARIVQAVNAKEA